MIAHFILTRTCGRVLALIALAALLPVASIDLRAAGDEGRQAPNYELASQWTLPKINKLIFDTQVTPHWLEFSDRFWYSFETRDGKKYFLVDPSARGLGTSLGSSPSAKSTAKSGASIKTPLFDQAKLAAMLAAATLVPMDGQHLSIKSIKFINKDTALLLEVEVPKDADIPGLKKKPAPTTTSQGQDEADTAADAPQQRRGVNAGVGDDQEGEGSKKSIGFEYDLASGKLALVPDFEPSKKPVWASVAPDDSVVVFARGQNLYMMDAANYAKAKKNPADASVAETQITTDAEEHFGYAKRLNDDLAIAGSKLAIGTDDNINLAYRERRRAHDDKGNH